MRPTPDKMSAFLEQLKKKMNLKSLVVTLAAIVVFTTTYLLILPAFTLDKDEAMEQGGIDVVAVETAAEADQAEAVPAEDTASEEPAAETDQAEATAAEGVVPEEPAASADQAVEDAVSEEPAVSKEEAGKAKPADQAEATDKPEAVAKPDVKLLTKEKTLKAEQAKGDDFEVSAIVDKDAKVPEDVFLQATELTKDTEGFDYDAYYEKALKALKKDSDDVEGIKTIKFYDISLEAESQEESVEPKAAVNVKIEYEDGLKVDDKDNVRIVHFDEQENGDVKAEVLDNKENKVKTTVNNESELTEASFDTEGFSIFAVAETETITATLMTADGETLKVTVNYGPDAQIPEGAILEVEEVQDGDEGWFDRSVRLADVLNKNYGNVTLSDARFLNISIMVDGKEFEPKAPVQVKIEYDEPLVTEDAVDYGYDGFTGEKIIPQKKANRFVVVHYTDEKTELIESNNISGDSGFIETTYNVGGFSDTDLAYMYDYDTYEAGDDYNPSAAIHTADILSELKATETNTTGGALKRAAKAVGEALRGAGDVPAHSKKLIDNENGTYTIGLDVTGDAETEGNKASNANVIIIYDTSTSMEAPGQVWGGGTDDQRNNYVPMATGGRGIDSTGSNQTTYSDGIYFQLYRQNDSGSGYTALTNDNYSGTVYRRTGSGRPRDPYVYTEYRGQRYSYSIDRADASEKVVYDFTNALFGYQNPDDPATPEDESTNIQAAFITFDASANYGNTPPPLGRWTSNKNDILSRVDSSGTNHILNYHNYTNWTDALDAAEDLVDSADDDPTYVVFITDGRPQTEDESAARPNYETSKVIAKRIQDKCAEKGGELYGIFAFANSDDWLAALMYYAYNGSDPSNPGTTFDTEGYYKANDTAALTQAINEIFQKIVQTLGVTDVTIADGTTSNVATNTGIAHLLEVDTSSFQYWMSIPVTAASGGKYTFSMPDKTTGNPITYTVTPSGGNVTISWTDKDGVDRTASYAGKVNLNTLTIEWKPGEEGKTDFYPAAPDASFNSSTGSVDWNLHPVGTLLDDVTYTVTFDCYPSQDTLDMIADLKNGDIQYSSLDPAIRQYLTSDYKLKTNTTATLSYTDTRTENGPQTSGFTNPDPQPVNATEEVTVSKNWNNTLDSREGWKHDLQLYVTRDGEEVHTVELSQGNNWTNKAWISYGILTVDEDGTVHQKTTGHDYSFSEDLETGYYWEIKAPTVRPMLINNTITMLKLVKAADAPTEITSATNANAKAEVGDDTYYKLTIGDEVEYYVVIEDVNAALTATNHRRSYLDVVKTVTGSNVPAGDEFEFTMTVNNANAETADPANVNSDAFVWFSIWDNVSNAMVTDPDAATAEGLRWQLNDETVVTTKPTANFNGYFCVPSGTPITVNMQNGYSLRFLNLPEGSTYTISESETMPKDGYSFVSIVGERGYDISGVIEYDPNDLDQYGDYVYYETIDKEEVIAYELDESGQPMTVTDDEGQIHYVYKSTGHRKSINNDWTTESTGTVSGQSITGTIEYVESAYKVEVTNKWNTIDVMLKKVDQNGTALDGSTFTLTSGGTTVGEYSPSGTDNPIDLGGLGIGIYKLEETGIPTNYAKADDVYFQVYKDTDGSLKARLVDESGSVLDDQSAISSETGTDGSIYTITVQDVLKTAKVKVIKEVVGSDADKSIPFAFTTTGVASQAQTASLVGDASADNHSVTYENVPYGTSVTVSETADASFATTYSVNGAAAVDGTSATFTVSDATVNEDGVAEVVFTNTRSTQYVRVYKYETGNLQKGLEGAEFTLTSPSGDSETGLTTGEDGYLVYDEETIFQLSANTSSYTLTETKSPDGYHMIAGDVTFTVSTDGVTATGDGYDLDTETKDIGGVEVTVYTIRIQNSAGEELPMTGGIGTTIFYILGSLLVIGCGIVLVSRRRMGNKK